MTAVALLADLRRRGVVLTPAGDQIRYRAPRGALTEADRQAIRTHRDEVLAELRRSEADLSTETHQELGAVLIRSRRFGELWIALTDGIAAELRSEESERPAPRPVLLPADVTRLMNKPTATIEAVLNTMAVFPGSGLIQ